MKDALRFQKVISSSGVWILTYANHPTVSNYVEYICHNMSELYVRKLYIAVDVA